ncbi:hypothetical protein BOX15_Mlig019885g1 [Macrostomum lignano]|uniref:Uncharacterized protein n=1 Tax=Macrostomum lignano TaxID=282301 RepID=A0A267F5B2_9PLAT|nr:hypothetical protein BOX15_Mlig019885g1 [Macrostomum lignano]
MTESVDLITDGGVTKNLNQSSDFDDDKSQTQVDITSDDPLTFESLDCSKADGAVELINKSLTTSLASLSCICQLPDGRLAVGFQQSLLLVSLEETAAFDNIPLPARCSASCLHADSRGDRLLVGCFNGSVLYIPIGRSGPVRTLHKAANSDGCSKRVELLCSFGRSGRYLIRRLGEPVSLLLPADSSSSRRRFICRPLKSCILDLPTDQSRPIGACMLSGDRAQLLLVHGCSSMGCLDLRLLNADGKVVAKLDGHKCHSRRLLAVGPLTGGSLTGSRSSALLGTGSETGEIKIWLATLAAGKIEMQQVLSCKHTSEVAVLELVQLPGEQEPALLVGDRTGRLEICRVLAKVNEASL